MVYLRDNDGIYAVSEYDLARRSSNFWPFVMGLKHNVNLIRRDLHDSSFVRVAEKNGVFLYAVRRGMDVKRLQTFLKIEYPKWSTLPIVPNSDDPNTIDYLLNTT